MNEIQNAAFSFEDFKIISFSFTQPTEDGPYPIGVEIIPSGVYFEKEGRFMVYIAFTAANADSDKDIVKANLEAQFMFKAPISHSDIPSYFYKNSLAIVFPYLRAFISSLTIQANITEVKLPLLNLTSLEQSFRDKTKVVL